MTLPPLFQGAEHLPFTLAGSAPGGPAALLVHGFPGTPAELRPLAEALHAAGWTARGLLLPGFGPEFAALGRQHAADWIGAVRGALDAALDLVAAHVRRCSSQTGRRRRHRRLRRQAQPRARPQK